MVKSPSKLEKMIAEQSGPITRSMLLLDLKALGLEEGMTVLTHTSLSSIGWLPGGAATLALCMYEALGPKGTVVVPTQSSDLSDPIHWSNPPIPRDWFEETKATMAPFDPYTTASSGQGVFPEVVRTHPDALRSVHPHTSFAALGPRAAEITNDHALHSPLGEQSPLQTLYDLDAMVLFLGSGFDSNTCFHLAEERLHDAPSHLQGAPMVIDGKQQWVSFDVTDYDTEDFEDCGEAFEKSTDVRRGTVGRADCRVFRIRTAVEFATIWFKENR